MIHYSVAQRTNGIGSGIAMGARPRDVLPMILAQGVRMGAIGESAWTACAFALTRLMPGLLFGISAFDPITFIAMALAPMGVTVAACYVPARRAMEADPMTALRYE